VDNAVADDFAVYAIFKRDKNIANLSLLLHVTLTHTACFPVLSVYFYVINEFVVVCRAVR